MRKLLLLTFVSTALSCGGFGTGNHACDLRPKNPQCTDWRDLVGPAVTQESTCRTLISAKGAGEWKSGQKCPAEGSVGGCQSDSGVGKQTNWYYAPKTKADVQAECASDKSTFVEP
jgi:hypothetical protein